MCFLTFPLSLPLQGNVYWLVWLTFVWNYLQVRLKKCGLHHPMYLIEDYKSMQHYSVPEGNIKQAIINTQVNTETSLVENWIFFCNNYIEEIFDFLKVVDSRSDNRIDGFNS